MAILSVLRINLLGAVCIGAVLNGEAAGLQGNSDSSTPPTRQARASTRSGTSDGTRSNSPAVTAGSSAQDPSATPQTPTEGQHHEQPCGLSKLGRCVTDLAQDQAAIWTSPFRIKARDLKWVVPFAGI